MYIGLYKAPNKALSCLVLKVIYITLSEEPLHCQATKIYTFRFKTLTSTDELQDTEPPRHETICLYLVLKFYTFTSFYVCQYVSYISVALQLR